MRGYILSEHERTMIKQYLETGEKLEGFKVLLHRVRKSSDPGISRREILALIEQLLKKAGDKA